MSENNETRLYELRITVELFHRGTTLMDVFDSERTVSTRTQELDGDLLDLANMVDAVGGIASGLTAAMIDRAERQESGIPY